MREKQDKKNREINMEIRPLHYAIAEAVVRADEFFGTCIKKLVSEKCTWKSCSEGLRVAMVYPEGDKTSVRVRVIPVGWPASAAMYFSFVYSKKSWHLLNGQLNASHLGLTRALLFQFFTNNKTFVAAQDPFSQECFRKMGNPP